uniref:Uncharacterized protein n=1 Tax=Anguilla anguilla TaxID=7936 RepID=A0A0E9USL4_ANGAN
MYYLTTVLMQFGHKFMQKTYVGLNRNRA